MRKKNGFVFMETIVVISVLSITLMLLFGSYSYILRKSRSKNTFDTSETVYKTYYVRSLIENYKKEHNRTKQIVNNAKENEWLNRFDATTIDYIRSISASFDKYILIVKYKKHYSDGSYEVFHSSMEVNS